MERIISEPPLLQQYRLEAKTILEQSFRPDILIPKLRGLYAQIQVDLKEDPFPSARATNPGDSGYDEIVASMEAFIRRRYELAKDQLNSPGQRPASHAPAVTQQDGPNPGPPSHDAPTDLRVTKVTPGTVEMHWQDHAQGAVATVVQRCRGADCEDFVNAIGQNGNGVTSAIDKSVQRGATYRYRVYAVFPTPRGPRGTGVSNVITVTVPDE
jgi:hypothetical protein